MVARQWQFSVGTRDGCDLGCHGLRAPLRTRPQVGTMGRLRHGWGHRLLSYHAFVALSVGRIYGCRARLLDHEVRGSTLSSRSDSGAASDRGCSPVFFHHRSIQVHCARDLLRGLRSLPIDDRDSGGNRRERQWAAPFRCNSSPHGSPGRFSDSGSDGRSRRVSIRSALRRVRDQRRLRRNPAQLRIEPQGGFPRRRNLYRQKRHSEPSPPTSHSLRISLSRLATTFPSGSRPSFSLSAREDSLHWG